MEQTIPKPNRTKLNKIKQNLTMTLVKFKELRSKFPLSKFEAKRMKQNNEMIVATDEHN